MATIEDESAALLLALIGATVVDRLKAADIRLLPPDRFCYVILEKSGARNIYAARWNSVEELVMVQKFSRDNSFGRELAARLTLNMGTGETIGLRDPAVKERGGFPSYGTLFAVIVCDSRPAHQDLMKIFEHVLRG